MDVMNNSLQNKGMLAQQQFAKTTAAMNNKMNQEREQLSAILNNELDNMLNVDYYE